MCPERRLLSSAEHSAGFKGPTFVREPSFNKPADRHAAKQLQVPEEVSLLVPLIPVISHGNRGRGGGVYVHDPAAARCTAFASGSGCEVCEMHRIRRREAGESDRYHSQVSPLGQSGLALLS